MQRVAARLVKLEDKDQADAARLFVLISGLRGLEQPVTRRLSMIDIMENKVFSRVIRKSIREGRVKGRAEGLAEGQIRSLVGMLEAKFGSPLSPAALRQISAGSAADLDRWLIRVLSADRVGDIFN